MGRSFALTPVFSPQGHILVLAGFGNLRGQMEVWDVKKYKQVRKNKPETSLIWRSMISIITNNRPRIRTLSNATLL